MDLSVVGPAYNEAPILHRNVTALRRFLQARFAGQQWQVVIADNGSTDGTTAIAAQLAQADPRVVHLVVPTRGKGAAIRAAWQRYPATVRCFMDADLATDLDALPTLVSAVADDGIDLAYGSRYLVGAAVERSWSRRLTSAGYRWLQRLVLPTAISDAPCGFKAVGARLCEHLLPNVRDNGWFFDSELALSADRLGFRTRGVAVRWREPRDRGQGSKVNVLRLSLTYSRRLWQLRRRLHRGGLAQP